MSKLYFVEPGFSEPTRIYKVKLALIEELDGATMDDVAERLDELGVKQLIIDNAYPHLIDRIKARFVVKKLLRRTPKAQLASEGDK